MIVPTVGRVVLYWPQEGEMTWEDPAFGDQPCVALVAAVTTHTLVNLAVFDHGGFPKPKRDVRLVQPEESFTRLPGTCEWMEFQRGQAKKVEELEQKLKAAGGP